MYTKIQFDISYFDQDTKQSMLHVKMQKNHKVFSQLSAALASVQQKMCCLVDCY